MWRLIAGIAKHADDVVRPIARNADDLARPFVRNVDDLEKPFARNAGDLARRNPGDIPNTRPPLGSHRTVSSFPRAAATERSSCERDSSPTGLRAACEKFSAIRAKPFPRRIVNLADSRFAHMLYLHMAALAAVNELSFSAPTLLEETVLHEQHYWSKQFEAKYSDSILDMESFVAGAPTDYGGHYFTRWST